MNYDWVLFVHCLYLVGSLDQVDDVTVRWFYCTRLSPVYIRNSFWSVEFFSSLYITARADICLQFVFTYNLSMKFTQLYMTVSIRHSNNIVRLRTICFDIHTYQVVNICIGFVFCGVTDDQYIDFPSKKRIARNIADYSCKRIRLMLAKSSNDKAIESFSWYSARLFRIRTMIFRTISIYRKAVILACYKSADME